MHAPAAPRPRNVLVVECSPELSWYDTFRGVAGTRLGAVAVAPVGD